MNLCFRYEVIFYISEFRIFCNLKFVCMNMNFIFLKAILRCLCASVIKCSVKCVSKNAFQVKDSAPDWSYYGPRKVKFNPFLVIHLQGCFLDFVMHGAGWLNVQIGMSQVIVEPHGNCFCGVKEATTSACPEERRMDQKVSTILSTVVWLHVEAGNQYLVEWSCVYVYVCRYNIVCSCNCIFYSLFIQ